MLHNINRILKISISFQIQIKSNISPRNLNNLTKIDVDVMFEVVTINDGKTISCYIVNSKSSLVNLAGEYMDLVIALSMEWNDGRLKWDPYRFDDKPIRELRVENNKIWTPKIDLANRIHEFDSEIDLKATVGYDGKKTTFNQIFIITPILHHYYTMNLLR